MLYFYPRLSTPDLLLLRGPGPGLGNLLFPWARAELLARRFSGICLPPTWRNFKLGPLLRGEADRRTYGRLFKARNLGALRQTLRARMTLPSINEAQLLEGNGPAGDALVVVSGPADAFASLCGHAPTLRMLLWQRLRQEPRALTGRIAVHIRAGDFVDRGDLYGRNARVAPAWFAGEVGRVRERLGMLPVTVFSDDAALVAPAFKHVEAVEFARPVNALCDLLSMSTAEHIVVSNSTFSLWAAFLSSGTVSARHRAVFDDYRLDDSSFSERIR